MCNICDAVIERETIEIPCAYCHVPVRTLWATKGGGLLHGDYDLVADSIFHKQCWEEVMKGYKQDDIRDN